jgi:hypothetical protein
MKPKNAGADEPSKQVGMVEQEKRKNAREIGSLRKDVIEEMF